MSYSQKNNFISIDTPLGADTLMLTGFAGTESISALFEFDLSLLSLNNNISFEEIIGKNVTISIILANKEKQYLNGLIIRFSQEKVGKDKKGVPLSMYSATMVPWFWLLTGSVNSRIFQDLSVPQIIEEVFTEKGFQDFKLILKDSYPQREYCVQYRETDYQFISRLLEEEGIYYFFEHKQGSHTLILADKPSEHKPCPNQLTASFSTDSTWTGDDVVVDLETIKQIRPGKYSLNDFNFEMPNADLNVEAPGLIKFQPPGDREIYEHPGFYTNKSDGNRLANIRMQEEEVRVTTIKGKSVCRSFTSGYRFTLSDYHREDMNNKPYVLTSVTHMANEGSYTGVSSSGGVSYMNTFTCIPFDVPFRPLRKTPKPVICGTQTDFVTGPSGNEIYSDEHGRVKVQFHWDRLGKKDESSSCWIRVSQTSAGQGWGGLNIPRIGHEVIVSFIEGDPDRPIITGRVYNGSNAPPYSVKDSAAKSTVKIQSIGGGGNNEFRFDATENAEEIFLHGQKDWNIEIENNKKQSIGNDETLTVNNNRDKTVNNNQSETINANKTISVGKNHSESISKNMDLSIGKNMDISVGKNKNETVQSSSTEDVSSSKTLSIGSDYQISVSADMDISVDGNKSEDVGGSKQLSVSGNSSGSVGKKYILKAKKVLIDAKEEITLKSGSASITLKKNGDIKIKGSGKVIIKGSKIAQN